MIPAIIRGALEQRLVLVVLSIVLFVFGIDAARKLSVDAFPDVTNIQVQIATEAIGRSPDEMERLVTVPIEIAMTGLPAMTEMRSLNKPGLSLITLVFTDKTNVYFARQLVMERLADVRGRMPEGVTPVLGPVSTGLGEVYQYTLQKADDGDRELSREELTRRRIAQDWVVRPLLRSIQGVAEINSQGGFVKQYHVRVNPDRLRHYGLSLNQVFDSVAANNANAGGGVLNQNAEQFLIRSIGLVRSIDDFRNIVVKNEGATPVYLRDVAQIEEGAAVRVGGLVKDGQTEAVGAVVMMLAGGNAKEIVGRIKERVEEINSKGMLPEGLQIVPYYDRSELVDAALATVIKVLVEGVLFVIVVLFLFLGDVRSSLIVIATLVLTPLLTFMTMNKLGISANLMSLGGLAIAIGLMVDGSVVVVENAFARLSHGHAEGEHNKIRVIFEAVKEVAVPVIFGVGIIILVFLPLMTLEGMEGKMFAPLAYTIAIALAVSLVLSLTLTPVLCTYVLKGGSEEDTRLIRALKRPWLPMLGWAVNNSRKTFLMAITAFGLSIAMLPFLGTSFIPEMKEGSIVPGVARVPNISLDESIKMEREILRRVLEVPGVKGVVSPVGRGESPADPQSQNEGVPIVSLLPRDEWPEGWTQDTIANAMRDKIADLPGISIAMAQPIAQRVAELVTGVRSDVAVKVFGDDMDTLLDTANRIARVVANIEGARDMRVEKVSGQQYLNIEVDRAAIARYGLNVADINQIVEIALGGKVATQVFEGQRRFDATVRVPEVFRDDPNAIGDILINTPGGALVPLGSVATIEVQEGAAQISREMAKRRVVVGVNVADRDLGGFVAELQQKVAAQVPMPEGYYLEWGGQFQAMERALSHLAVIVPVTIAAIFFLLFLLFGSVRYATLIITVLPFASIGGVIGLAVSGEYLSVPASVGFIALWGIAVLNGVVLVSYIRSLRNDGLPVEEAVLQGAKMRFRPVMMTATVALLGLLPFLFATGPGSEVQRPLAVVVIGGLITSTLLTLVVVPAIYRWFDEPDAQPV